MLLRSWSMDYVGRTGDWYEQSTAGDGDTQSCLCVGRGTLCLLGSRLQRDTKVTGRDAEHAVPWHCSKEGKRKEDHLRKRMGLA